MSDDDVLFDCYGLRFVLRGDKLYATVECRDPLLRRAVQKSLLGGSQEPPTEGEFPLSESPCLDTIRSCVEALSPTEERSWEPNTLTPASDAVHFLEKITPQMVPSCSDVVLVSSEEERRTWAGTCWVLKEAKEAPQEQEVQAAPTRRSKAPKKATASQKSQEAAPTAPRNGTGWSKMCRLMDVVRTMLDATYRESRMEKPNWQPKEIPHPMQFFYDNWPNFAEAQLSSLLRMSVLGHFMRICGVNSLTLEDFKKYYTTEVELSDCDIAYIMLQALRSMLKNTDACITTEARIKNTRLVFSGENGAILRQFKVECACDRGKRLDFVIALLKFLMTKKEEPTRQEIESKGSLTFQSLMVRIFKERDQGDITLEREKEFLAYAMSVFFEVCTSDVIWPSETNPGTAEAAVEV